MNSLSFLPSLLACPACGFDPNSSTTAAANLAIGFMLVVLVGVLGSFLTFIIKMARAEKRAVAARARPVENPGTAPTHF